MASIGGPGLVKYRPPHGSAAPAMTITAPIRGSRQQLPSAATSAASAPSECPATPMRAGSISPENGPWAPRDARASCEIRKLRSPGWFTMSDSSSPPTAFGFVSGNVGAATT
jgi:hypothetical protein